MDPEAAAKRKQRAQQRKAAGRKRQVGGGGRGGGGALHCGLGALQRRRQRDVLQAPHAFALLSAAGAPPLPPPPRVPGECFPSTYRSPCATRPPLCCAAPPLQLEEVRRLRSVGVVVKNKKARRGPSRE